MVSAGHGRSAIAALRNGVEPERSALRLGFVALPCGRLGYLDFSLSGSPAGRISWRLAFVGCCVAIGVDRGWCGLCSLPPSTDPPIQALQIRLSALPSPPVCWGLPIYFAASESTRLFLLCRNVLHPTC